MHPTRPSRSRSRAAAAAWTTPWAALLHAAAYSPNVGDTRDRRLTARHYLLYCWPMADVVARGGIGSLRAPC
eukprot:7288424-Prymnesium_polylepis.1